MDHSPLFHTWTQPLKYTSVIHLEMANKNISLQYSWTILWIIHLILFADSRFHTHLEWHMAICKKNIYSAHIYKLIWLIWCSNLEWTKLNLKHNIPYNSQSETYFVYETLQYKQMFPGNCYKIWEYLENWSN